MSKQREAFEAWANEEEIPLVMSECLTLDELRPTLLAWKAWQASRAAALGDALAAIGEVEAQIIAGRRSFIQASVVYADAVNRALKEQS